jgi:hypothetical protein
MAAIPLVIGGVAALGYGAYKLLGGDKECHSWTILLLAAASEREQQDARDGSDVDEAGSSELGDRN